MDRSRPHPFQLVLALAGLVLAVVGLVRLGQGRPDRHRTVAAATTVATASDVADDAASTDGAASTDSAAGTAAAAAPATGDVAIAIANFAFDPDPIEVAVGTKVTWTNKDSFAHTATVADAASGASFDSKNLNEGESYSYAFDKVGTYAYKCAIHNSMTGTVVVK